MRLVLVFLLIFITYPAMALEVTGLYATPKSWGEHVAISLSDSATAHVFLVENPPRLVIDLPESRFKGGASMPQHYRGTLIQNVRFGFHTQQVSRMVLNLAAPVTLQNVQNKTLENSGTYWIGFDLLNSDSQKVKPLSAPIEKPVVKSDEKPMIVIDAGHGGQDPGTAGFGGTEEKNITLRFAHALRDALLATGKYNVTLTRSDDRYLFLKDRVARARAAKGDLFISLHADSAPTRAARGLSVYTISETASDKQSEALAAKENKADVIGGMDLSGTSPDVADILIDLTQRETRQKSARFADLAINNLGREVNLLSHTHRFAGFAVLKAPDIPSVLIEVGFLTNPREETMLKSSQYENKVVHALLKAIDSYFGKNKK